MVQSKIEIFTAMLAEQPENAMIWYGLAGEQYKLENWAEAAKSLRQVVSLNLGGGGGVGRTRSAPFAVTNLSASSGGFSRDLVERRISNLKRFHRWCSLQHFRQRLQYVRISRAVVSFRVLFCVPETDTDG
jgi:hypothetical protein